MKMSKKANKVTEEYVLEKFVDLMDSDASWNVKVRGLELLGKYLAMFQDQRKVDINIRSLVAGASLDQLEKLAGDGYGESQKKIKDPGERYLGMHSTSDGGSVQSEGEGEREADPGSAV